MPELLPEIYVCNTKHLIHSYVDTSYVFLPCIGVLNLNQWTSLFGGTCIHGGITFSESSGLMVGVFAIKYGREFILTVI